MDYVSLKESVLKKNLLVVDDSALMRRIICDIIKENPSYEVKETCRNGKEALERLRLTTYDGVLLDVNMPVMGGLELLEALQKEDIETTVIMVSTLTVKDADVTIRAMELGATDFVTKPENISDAKGKGFADSLISILDAVINTGNYRRAFEKPKPVRVPVVPPRSTSKGTVARSRQAPSSGKKLIALASSTGGPKSLQSVIPYLPANMDAPMIP